MESGDQGVSFFGFVLEGGGEGLHSLVVSGETVDSAFDENESEFAVLVLSISL